MNSSNNVTIKSHAQKVATCRKGNVKNWKQRHAAVSSSVLKFTVCLELDSVITLWINGQVFAFKVVSLTLATLHPADS